jgi:hypothetical protein
VNGASCKILLRFVAVVGTVAVAVAVVSEAEAVAVAVAVAGAVIICLRERLDYNMRNKRLRYEESIDRCWHRKQATGVSSALRYRCYYITLRSMRSSSISPRIWIIW